MQQTKIFTWQLQQHQLPLIWEARVLCALEAAENHLKSKLSCFQLAIRVANNRKESIFT